jgi:hypothetical protein
MTEIAAKGVRASQTRPMRHSTGAIRAHQHVELVLTRVVTKFHSAATEAPTRYKDWECDDSERD